MATKGIKKIKLSPFVYKVKGKTHFLLTDLLNGRLFHLPPHGDVAELKKKLVEKGLAFATEGVIPFKFQMSLRKFEDNFYLRQLQIRITGTCSEDCSTCGQICACTKEKGDLPDTVVNEIIKQFHFFPVMQVIFTGGNPLLKWELLLHLKKEIKADSYAILYLGSLSEEWQKRLLENNIKWYSKPLHHSPIAQETMSTQALSFFYNQVFNPCWGNTIAIDCTGTLKPCLWWPENLGNITSKNIKTMITQHEWDYYWKLSKNKIKICECCEYRYNCFDCRVSVVQANLSINEKPPLCSYNIETGLWEI